MKEQSNRIGALDGIKGISAIIIACVYHLAWADYVYPNGMPFESIKVFQLLYQHGYFLVDMFLLISGFLFFTLYTDKIDDGMTFGDFFLRRFVRIVPLMHFSLFLFLCIAMWYYLKNGVFWLWGGVVHKVVL